MPEYHINELLQRRNGLPCKVPGCTRPKLKQHISYCRTHRNAFDVWGHPDGRAIRIKDFKLYIPRVQQFLSDHPNEALDKIQHFFQNMLFRSPRLTTGIGRREFPWLSNMVRTSDNIQNRPDVLVDRLIALMLFDENQRAFKNDEHKNRVFAYHTLTYGRILMNGGERHWRTGRTKKMAPNRQGKLLHALGLAIWKSTGVFWITALRGILMEQRLKEEWKKSICVKTPTVAGR